MVIFQLQNSSFIKSLHILPKRYEHSSLDKHFILFWFNSDGNGSMGYPNQFIYDVEYLLSGINEHEGKLVQQTTQTKIFWLYVL
jgi:hypothetical protein